MVMIKKYIFQEMFYMNQIKSFHILSTPAYSPTTPVSIATSIPVTLQTH